MNAAVVRTTLIPCLKLDYPSVNETQIFTPFVKVADAQLITFVEKYIAP